MLYWSVCYHGGLVNVSVSFDSSCLLHAQALLLSLALSYQKATIALTLAVKGSGVRPLPWMVPWLQLWMQLPSTRVKMGLTGVAKTGNCPPAHGLHCSDHGLLRSADACWRLARAAG